MILFVLIKEDTTDFNCRKGEVADTAHGADPPPLWGSGLTAAAYRRGAYSSHFWL